MQKTLIRVTLLIVLTGSFGLWIRGQATPTNNRTPVLLELFTSEGCSSCPPADRLLQSFDETQPFAGVDLIVLSEHVDYWNGDGWMDPYSASLFSDRQRWYAERFGLEGVYTPQVVLDGRLETVGSNAAAIKKAVEMFALSGKVRLTLSQPVRDGNRISFHLTTGKIPDGNGTTKAIIALAEDKVTSNVAGGENGGRTLTHVAVVRVLVPVGSVNGRSSFSKDIVIPIPPRMSAGGIRIVALLQDGKSHRVLGAAAEKI